MRSVLLSLVLLFGFATVVGAEQVVVVGEGSVNPDGYVWKSPYWWKAGVPYIRTWVTTYYRYGEPWGYWVYNAVALPKATDPDFRIKMLEIYAAQRKYEADNIKQQVLQKAFEDSIKALGLDSVFKYQGVVGSPFNGVPAAFQLSSAGVNGSTIYGYSYNTAADVYNQADLNILFQALGRSTHDTADLLGQANASLADVVKLANQGLTRAEEIRQQGIAAKAALEAARAAPQGSVTTQNSTVVIDHNQKAVNGALFRQQACGACHSGQRLEGKFDITKLPLLSNQEKAKVLERVTTHDSKRVMPRDLKDTGKPGISLTVDQIRLLFSN